MKIAISYPPLESSKGVPLLTQNRQFQWFRNPTYIYPVIPAYAATLLKSKGFEVFWDDAIAQGLTYAQWKERIVQERPGVIVLETKTPVVERHWKIIRELKTESRKSESRDPLLTFPSGKGDNSWEPKIVFLGDHVTALPQESLENSEVDFVIASGDYDFMLLNLAEHLTDGTPLEGGFWYRNEKGEIVNSGPADLSQHDLSTVPLLDRELTQWNLYAFKNGNFKFTPGAYMMSGRDCWWGRCAFCSWTTLFPGENFRTQSPDRALSEVGNLIRLGVKEIMEDSESLPVGSWLNEFCKGMIERGYNKKVTLDCNMRINGIKSLETWKLMKEAGFRLILFGLESANQETLDRINKNLKVEEIEPGLQMCKEAGLEPHITAMIGYPWETKAMARKTVALAKRLFQKGYVDTLQGTILVPYPGTPLYRECLRNNWLLTTDYSRFDQREQVMKSSLSGSEARKMVQNLYTSLVTPRFIFRKIAAIRSWEDVRFLWRAGWKVLGHLTDFKRN